MSSQESPNYHTLSEDNPQSSHKYAPTFLERSFETFKGPFFQIEANRYQTKFKRDLVSNFA